MANFTDYALHQRVLGDELQEDGIDGVCSRRDISLLSEY
jgi:hypothetical protein